MKWKNMPLSHKIATVIAAIAVVFWLIPKVDPNLLPFNTTYPAIVVVTVSEAVVYWKEKRTLSYLLIAGAVISLTCFILEMVFLK